MRNEAVFKLKDMFDPNSNLSRWIVKLAMIRNDLFYIHSSFVNLAQDEEKSKYGEMIYYFRLAASHFREAAKFIDSHNNDGKVQEFLKLLDKESIAKYNMVLESCTPWDNSFVKEKVKPIRDNFFHYDLKNFEVEYFKLDDFFTRVVSSGEKRREQNLVFADEIAINVIFGDYTEEDIKKILSQLSELMTALIGFVDDTVGRYINLHKGRIAFFIRNNI